MSYIILKKKQINNNLCLLKLWWFNNYHDQIVFSIIYSLNDFFYQSEIMIAIYHDLSIYRN